MLMEKQFDFQIQRNKVAQYAFWVHIMSILLVGVWFFGLGIVVALVYAYTIGKWLPQKQADALQYWLDGPVLHVNEGVYFLKRKAIPLDRITDVMLAQTPLLRKFDIWAMQIQTAGTGGKSMAEAILIGLNDPEAVRNEILNARKTFLSQRMAS